MWHKTEIEQKAMDHAAAMGGEIIEEVMSNGGSSDFSQWSEEMYDNLVQAIVEGFTDKMRELAAKDKPNDVPF